MSQIHPAHEGVSDARPIPPAVLDAEAVLAPFLLRFRLTLLPHQPQASVTLSALGQDVVSPEASTNGSSMTLGFTNRPAFCDFVASDGARIHGRMHLQSISYPPGRLGVWCSLHFGAGTGALNSFEGILVTFPV